MPTRSVKDTNTSPRVSPSKAAQANAGEFDFSTLTVEDAPAPRRTTATSIDPDKNPANQWMTESWENRTANTNGTFLGKGKRLVVPTEEASKQVVNLIRAAATYLTGLGSARIGATVRVNQLADGKWEVLFAAKTAKNARKPKPTTAPDTTPTA